MTSATSEQSEERQLDVSVGTVKRLLCFAWENYGRAAKDDARNAMSYWDGYIRALQHVLEQERE